MLRFVFVTSLQQCEQRISKLNELLASLTEHNSLQTPTSDTMMSSVRLRTKQVHELVDLYESLRGQVSHRSHDLDLLHSKVKDSRGKLRGFSDVLGGMQLGTDLEMKTTQLDQLKVQDVSYYHNFYLHRWQPNYRNMTP